MLSFIKSNYGVLLSYTAVVLSIITIGIVYFKSVDKRVARVLESLILIVIVLVLAYGTQSTVLKLVDGQTVMQRDFPAEKSSAVLCAYKQLSEELSRWFVMFVVLGSFFGIVLPIGSYLLQIRAIRHKEDEVEEAIKESEKRAQNEIDKRTKKIKDDIDKVWRGHVVAAYVQFLSAVNDIEKEEWKLNATNRRELIFSLILVLKYLENTNNEKFVTEKIKGLAKKTGMISEKIGAINPDDKSKDSNVRKDRPQIHLSDKCSQCKDELSKISQFLENFGVFVSL